MEYVIGPVLALLISMKFSDYQTKEVNSSIKAIESRLDTIEKTLINQETELPKKVIQAMMLKQ